MCKYVFGTSYYLLNFCGVLQTIELISYYLLTCFPTWILFKHVSVIIFADFKPVVLMVDVKSRIVHRFISSESLKQCIWICLTNISYFKINIYII